jgi:ATP-dependent DNA ligase
MANRVLGIKSGGRVRLMSRTENDLADRFPILTQALAELPDESIDGELVALNETVDHHSMCSRIIAVPTRHFSFYAFDVLTVAGRSF